MQHLPGACHLPQQEVARGCLAQDTEFFVKRCYQRLEQTIRNHLNRQACAVATSSCAEPVRLPRVSPAISAGCTHMWHSTSCCSRKAAD